MSTKKALPNPLLLFTLSKYDVYFKFGFYSLIEGCTIYYNQQVSVRKRYLNGDKNVKNSTNCHVTKPVTLPNPVGLMGTLSRATLE
jgi:hypothetical protein